MVAEVAEVVGSQQTLDLEVMEAELRPVVVPLAVLVAMLDLTAEDSKAAAVVVRQATVHRHTLAMVETEALLEVVAEVGPTDITMQVEAMAATAATALSASPIGKRSLV